MTYYGNGDAGGIPGPDDGCLASARRHAVGHDLTEYYPLLRPELQRTSATQPGYQHGLKFVVGPEAFCAALA